MNLSPELLISVKSMTEFDRLISAEAGCGGSVANIIDLKDPRSGPLAPASQQLWQHAAAVAMPMPEMQLSAALGEFDQAIDVAGDLPTRFDYAKMGPSGQSTAAKLLQAWARIRESLPVSVELVAVAYADHTSRRNLARGRGLFDSASIRIPTRFLIDTFVKDGQSSREHLGQSELQRLIQQGSRFGHLGWRWPVRSDLGDAPWLTSNHGPHCIGLRGAVCDGDRTNTLSMNRCLQWRGLLGSKVPSKSRHLHPIQPRESVQPFFKVANQTSDERPGLTGAKLDLTMLVNSQNRIADNTGIMQLFQVDLAFVDNVEQGLPSEFNKFHGHL